ncbi:Spermidine N(1)-acetyltransferase [Vibrio aerogenes CECT 7868]|uniref:Spermidine N(1)-acetyltransferase n=1 Tax=Vibrio aerogenes CECT 7868 TaxID=1216006 RepID=A0A1M5WV77_9VIBR|nr:GNAT family N-acetyltransferase [Vibrio aerogenes]SHH91338.1 Spermidine N(1)-acetyltransferase [Vibrio aerogenes CECT 7868]
MEMTLRKAQSSDIGFLIELRDLTMRRYLEAVGMPTGREDYLQRVRYEFEHARIIECDGVAAGLFKAVYLTEQHQWYIFQIQIHPDYQNRKIGRQVIQSVIDQARTIGASVGLSVIKSNPAQRLYLRLGFKPVGESEAEYEMLLQPE